MAGLRSRYETNTTPMQCPEPSRAEIVEMIRNVDTRLTDLRAKMDSLRAIRPDATTQQHVDTLDQFQKQYEAKELLAFGEKRKLLDMFYRAVERDRPAFDRNAHCCMH